MAANIVNRIPGDLDEPFSPYDALQLGLKTSTAAARVDLESLNFILGYSAFVHKGEIPTDQVFPEGEATLRTIEHKSPAGSNSTVTIDGDDNLVVTKGASDLNPSIFELTVPHTDPKTSVMARIRFKINLAWTPGSPNWTSETDIVAPFLGLEIGLDNKMATVCLRDDGANGEVVFGGPLLAFGGARTTEGTFASDWLSQPDNSSYELLIFVDRYAHRISIGKISSGDTSVQPVGTIDYDDLVVFPAPGEAATQTREGASDTITLYFGNVGTAGSVLVIEDWGLYTDIRLPFNEGATRGSDSIVMKSDCPVQFDARNKVLPSKMNPGRWLPLDGDNAPEPTFGYRPGVNRTPEHIVIPKEGSASVGYTKKEPYLESLTEGYLAEIYMAEDLVIPYQETTAAGISVDDGDKVLKLYLLDNGARRSIGLLKDVALLGDMDQGYYLPSDDDDVTITKMGLYRLLFDRINDRIIVFNDWQKLLETSPSTATLPPSLTGEGQISFGHIEPVNTEVDLKVGLFNFFPVYGYWDLELGYEPQSVSLPADTRFYYTGIRTGEWYLTSDGFEINKLDVTYDDGCAYLTKTLSVGTQAADSAVLDFTAYVTKYTKGGVLSYPGVSTGVGANIDLNGKTIQFRFFDCGLHGKKIGIVPGSGSEDDILNQSELGRQFSASHDWTESTNYRILVSRNEFIKVWVDSITSDPVLTLLWDKATGSFDLPDTEGGNTQPNFHLGHFDGQTTSQSIWTRIGWGTGRGYELGVTIEYPGGVAPSSVFDGKLFLDGNIGEA